jgi:hypothetical protein
MLLLGPHIQLLHQVLQLIGPEPILAFHYIWLPNTLPVTGENSNVVSKASSVYVKLDGLQNDLSELIHILHVAERSSVKEIIQADIHLILSKIESLEDLNKNQLETNISWSRVAALKHNKSKYKKQKNSDPLYLTSNRYNLLNNDVDLEDNTPAKAVSVSVKKPTVNHVRKLKSNNCKKKKVINSMHKVLIVGDSHARGCAAEVKRRLNSEYEVIGFANPGSTMKAIKESATGKIDQLTKEDIVVLWGGSNDVAKNNSVSGMKHILDLVINATHTNVIQLSVPHRHDLINESCVNREVKILNNNLRNRLKRFNNVEMIEVTSERELYTKHGQHLNSRGKETMANKIALSIENVLKRKVDPINMKWQEDDRIDSQKQIEPTHEESASDCITMDNNLISNIMEKSDINNLAGEDTIQDTKTPTDGNETNRSSNRARKIPASRYSDFLWEN